MSAFGGLILTNKGRALQAKAQAGTQLNFTRMAAGDGELGGTSIQDLNALINEVKSLSITKVQILSDGKALVRTFFSNQDVVTGFYFREFGVFAQDPDEGEILYCYGNAGANAEYIPAGGGADTIEKNIDVITIVGNAANVTATIDESLIFATQAELTTLETALNNLAGTGRTTETVKGNADALAEHQAAAAPHSGHETIAGAQAKADDAAAAGIAAADSVQQNLTSHLNEHVKITISAIPPRNPDINTYWYEDLGESSELDGGDGDLIIGNASLLSNSDIWLKEI